MKGQERFALIGKSGAGKSEVGVILKDRLGLRIIKTGAICRQISKMLFGNEDKRSTQLLDDALTSIDASIFVRAALRDVRTEERFVIDALRFTSDLEIARARGCTIIRVVADDSTRCRRLKARGQEFSLESDGKHRSEVELDSVPVDHLIVNDGSLEVLRMRVAGAIQMGVG